MNDNQISLIGHAIELSDALDIPFHFHYTKDNMQFAFTKNGMDIKHHFSLLEVENIPDINILCRVLTEKVYGLLDTINRS